MGVSPFASYVSNYIFSYQEYKNTAPSTPVGRQIHRLSHGAKKIKRLHRGDLHLNSFETKPTFGHQLPKKDP